MAHNSGHKVNSIYDESNQSMFYSTSVHSKVILDKEVINNEVKIVNNEHISVFYISKTALHDVFKDK